ncbi:hypothetical protein [Roseateles amylovorans]|uniref:Uncharacterized protein n=1 Tax=Roseateles amylovorans TaxID=2978473 RepID=A0ABY6AVJ1_9BURK|nr:hypothetical protein [Roseateles amylovorans]UXH77221.1 hypothetical protein N4261_19720 [Roseateles amylovorans]
MRTFQTVGLILVALAFLPLWWMLSGVEPHALEGAPGAGIYFLFFSLPLLGLAAVMLIPSSLVLVSRRCRSVYGYRGPWLLLWAISSLYSGLFMGVMGMVLLDQLQRTLN